MSEPRLSGAHGSAAAGIGDVIGKLLDAGPALVWCEPTPTKERLKGFFGLWTKPEGLRPWLEGTALDEARLFWPNEAIHLVAAGERTRWAAFWEVGSVGDPDWLKVLKGMSDPENQRPMPVLQRSERKVLTLQKGDANRYYGSDRRPTDLSVGLTVTEYRSGTELVFWHLRAEGGR